MYNVSFGDAYLGPSLQKMTKNNSMSSAIKKELSEIQSTIQKNNLDKLDNVDMFINYDKDNKLFFTTISSKKQGIPINPAMDFDYTEIKKKDSKNYVKRFVDWATSWNEDYSTEALDNFRAILENLKYFKS